MAPNVVCNTAATQNDRTRAVAQGYTKQKLQDAALLLAGT